MADPTEPLDRERALRALTHAVRLQHRSVLAYTIVAGSSTGFAHLALSERLAEWAHAELDDARRLVEKLVALGGEAPKTVAEIEVHAAPERAVAWLIEAEREAIDAIHDAIDATGGDSASEALEHRVEHIVMRKQEQLEALERAARG